VIPDSISMNERDPTRGPTPADDVETQEWPGREDRMQPRADHGEHSYHGSSRLDGLAAVITGGVSGIGRAVAIAFAREGADVAIGYLDDMEADDAAETRRWVEAAGRRCLVRQFDVRERQACRDFVDAAVQEFGRLDIVVNNAAYQMAFDDVAELSEEQIDRTFRTNIYGFFFMVQAALPHLKEGAVILNTGSVTALDGNPKLLDYAATKGAIHVFTRSLAQGLAERGIRVNCVAPGPVWTPLIPSTFPQEDVASFGEDTFWGRPAQPAEIAPSYVFFASPEGRYYSGEVLAPTGKGTTR
jgi:NAD(P)-dependent dehydrogenase (short-subunit alcohol dehydrogenase family)